MELKNSFKIAQNIVNLYCDYNYIKLFQFTRTPCFMDAGNFFQRRTGMALHFVRVPFGLAKKMNLKKSFLMDKRVMWSIYK